MLLKTKKLYFNMNVKQFKKHLFNNENSKECIDLICT